MKNDDLDWLLTLDGASFELASGYVVEFTVKRSPKTDRHPHGISYALVFRRLGKSPLVKFDNAHAVTRNGRMRRKVIAFDHWHRTESDPGRPYQFESAAKLVDDFWREVKRTMNEKGIPNDL